MSANGLAKLIEQRYGEAPKMKHLGSLDDLRKRIDDCRGGEIDWSVMPLYENLLPCNLRYCYAFAWVPPTDYRAVLTD